MKKENSVNEVLKRIQNLPALPSVADEALRILNDSNSNKTDVVKIISKEQSFIAKILTIANSPIYGLRKEVSTLSFAIFVLGVKEIKKIVFALVIVESFKMVKDRYFTPEKFWLHSFVVANLSRKIAMDLDVINSGEAFVAGFLHDFSISVLHRDFKEEFEEICNLAATGSTYDYAEKEVLGVTHSEIAKIVLENWNLPKVHVDVISNHHTPSLAEKDVRLASIVHLADYITNTLKFADCDWDRDFVLDESIIEVLHFASMDSLNEFVELQREFINEQVDSIRNLL